MKRKIIECDICHREITKAINKIDKEIDELNKKIEELKQPKKTVKHQFFDCVEVDLVHISNTRCYVVRAIIYVEPELYKLARQRDYVYINGRRYYISDTETIDGRIIAKFVSSMGYGLEKAEEIAKDLLSNNIYGNIKA